MLEDEQEKSYYIKDDELNEYTEQLENKQKEFIEYINKTIEELECDDFDGVENITGALKDKINEIVREVRKLKEKL